MSALAPTIARVQGWETTRDTRYMHSRAAREISDWQAWLDAENKSPRTKEDYLRTIAVLVNMFDLDVDEFTSQHVTTCLTSFPNGSGRRTRRSALVSFFNYLDMHELIDKNPMRRVPKPKARGKRVPEVFTEEEIAQLCSLPRIDGVLFSILFYTGLRKSEARALQRRHIHLENGELVVMRGKGDKDRVVPFDEDPELKASPLSMAMADFDLFERIDPDENMWYTKPGGGSVVCRRFFDPDGNRRPLGERRFHDWYVSCLERAGVEYRPRSRAKDDEGIHNPHVTRHTFATNWLREGRRLETLSKVMGHTSIRTTYDLYGHLDNSDVRADLRIKRERVTS